MRIRKSELNDLETLMETYAYAREFMRSVGNVNQWINGYPTEELIKQNIEEGCSYICMNDETDDVIGTFYFRIGNDPTYAKIYDGEWLSDRPYGVVHRLATSGKVKGVGVDCLEWCFNQCRNIRVDTHKDNIVMQNIFRKLGYTKCGIIFLADGSERIAFQKEDK